MTDDELLTAFDKLAECHKEHLIDAAINEDDVLWVNLCNIYFRGADKIQRTGLRHYVRKAG